MGLLMYERYYFVFKITLILLLTSISSRSAPGVSDNALGKKRSVLTPNFEILLDNFAAPEKNINAAVENANEPAQDIKAPTGNINKPVQNYAPEGNVNKPVQYNAPEGNVNAPVGNVNEPVQNINAPVGNVNTPVGNVNAPVGNVNKPVQYNAPEGNVNAPVGNVNKPVQYNAPEGNVNAPEGNVNAPVGNVNKPVQYNAPEGNVNAPVGNVNEPVQNINAPVGNVNEPVQNINTPVRNVNEPAQTVNAPENNMNVDLGKTVVSQGKPHPDQIMSLPGMDFDINFKQYSGYLNATPGHFLFYWFAESQRYPASDPVILWLNGGPGCSSLDGFLSEIGPFRINEDTTTLMPNPYSWNKFANVLALESPVGVGFSYSVERNYTGINDNQVSLDNLIALDSFMDKFPQFQKNDFYIAGESYAGVYIPTLSMRIISVKTKLNYKGFLIGNGVLSEDILSNSIVFFSYFHGLIGSQTWEDLTSACCNNGTASKYNCKFTGRITKACDAQVTNAQNYIYSPEINHYNMYEKCYLAPNDTSPEKSSKYAVETQNLLEAHPKNKISRSGVPLLRAGSAPCTDDSKTDGYLGQPGVRKALREGSGVPQWEACNDLLFRSYNKLYVSMKPHIEKILESGRYRGLVYNGDIDTVCSYLADMWFVNELNLPVLKEFDVWTHDQQVAGFVKYFRNLTFMTVRGAGHMVPTDQPGRAFKIYQQFLKNEPYN